MKRLLITGSRHWTDRQIIVRELERIEASWGESVTLVHGNNGNKECTKGADRIAMSVAESMGWQTEPFHAKWGELGKGAGPKRNQEMVDAGADFCIAFPMGDSVGTWDCTKRASRAGIIVRVVGG